MSTEAISLILVTVIAATAGLQLLVSHFPALFVIGNSNDTALLQRVTLLEQEVLELRSRQEFLVAELQKAGALNMELQRQITVLTMQPTIEPNPLSPVLVAIGSDALLQLDLTSMRAVETETGMEFRRIQNATLELIKQYLDRARINGHPYDKLHLGVHSGPSGILLGGVLVESVKLSEILQGVKILLIAGCESSYVGDFLGVVPYVVTMTEKVPMNDAALFCRAFWTQIGRRKDPTEALRLALIAAPSGMNEYIESHWVWLLLFLPLVHFLFFSRFLGLA